MRRNISAVLTFIAATKYDTLFDMLYDDPFEMIYEKSRVAVIWPVTDLWSAGRLISKWQNDCPFEMIDDCLFESVAVSIGEENRNGDENPGEVAVRQGFFRA